MVYRRRKATRRGRRTRAAFRKATGRYRSRAARLGRFSARRVDRSQARALKGHSLQLKALRAAVLPPMKKLAEAEFEANSLRHGYRTFGLCHWLQPHLGIAGVAGSYEPYSNDTTHCETDNEQLSMSKFDQTNNEYELNIGNGNKSTIMMLYNAANNDKAKASRDSPVLECRRALIYEPVSLLELAAAKRRDEAGGNAGANTQYNWRQNRRVGDVHISGSFHINMRQGTPPNWALVEGSMINQGGHWPGNLLPAANGELQRGSMGRFIGADPFDPQYVRATCILVYDMGDGTGVTGLDPIELNRARLFSSSSGQNGERPNYTTQGGFMDAPDLHRYAPTLGELYDELEWDQSGNAIWPAYRRSNSPNPDTFHPRATSLLIEEGNGSEGYKDNYNGILTYDVMKAPIKRRKPVRNMRPGRGTITKNGQFGQTGELEHAILDNEGYGNDQSTTDSAATPQYSVDPYQKGYTGRRFKVLHDKVIKFAPGDRGGQSGHGNARDQAEIKFSYRLPDNLFPLDGPNSTKRYVNGAKYRVFWYFTTSCSPYVAGEQVAVNVGAEYVDGVHYTGLHEFRVSRGSEKVSWREKP